MEKTTGTLSSEELNPVASGNRDTDLEASSKVGTVECREWAARCKKSQIPTKEAAVRRTRLKNSENT